MGSSSSASRETRPFFPSVEVTAARAKRGKDDAIFVEVAPLDFDLLLMQGCSLHLDVAARPGDTLHLTTTVGPLDSRRIAQAEVSSVERAPENDASTHLIGFRIIPAGQPEHAVAPPAANESRSAPPPSSSETRVFVVLGSRRHDLELEEVTGTHALGHFAAKVQPGAAAMFCYARGARRFFVPCEISDADGGSAKLTFSSTRGFDAKALASELQVHQPWVRLG